MSDSSEEGLKALRERTREKLRAGLQNVSRLEGACDPKQLDAWIQRETEKYGGKRLEVPDE